MDCAYLHQLSLNNNQVIYLQSNLKIVTDYKSIDEEDTAFFLKSEEFNSGSLLFVDTDKYGTLICSRNGFRLFLLRHF